MEQHGDKYHAGTGPLYNINFWIIMHDQQYLNDYFRNHWKPSLDAYTYSAYEVIAKNIQPHEWLLDVGCGYNPFKSLVSHVVGVDPAMDQADFQVTIEDFYATRLFDVATCLGSLNFGDDAVVGRQINKMVSHLRPRSRVYWRLNPGRRDHASEKCQGIPFYPWSHRRLQDFAELHDFRQVNEQSETNGRVVRLYAEWHRS
jgi:hypothetical protein